MLYVALLQKFPRRGFVCPDQKNCSACRTVPKKARVESKSKLDVADGLFVSKGRGKEQDQTSKGSNSEEREEVSSEVAVIGSNHLSGSNVVGKFSDGILHHVQLRGFGNKCRCGCYNIKESDEIIKLIALEVFPMVHDMKV